MNVKGTDLRLVEVVERRYKRKWVRVRGVRFATNILDKSQRDYTKCERVIEGEVEGVSKSGYGKISKGRDKGLGGVKSYGVRYKLGGEYKEVTTLELGQFKKVIYRELDIDSMLLGRGYGDVDGLEYESEDIRFYRRYLKGARVLTRECFDYLVETEEIWCRGVLEIDEGVSLKGVSVEDLISLPISTELGFAFKDYSLQITEEQAKEIDWGEDVLGEYEWGKRYDWFNGEYLKVGISGKNQIYVIGVGKGEKGRVVKLWYKD